MDKEKTVPLEICKEYALKILEVNRDVDVNVLINAFGLAITCLFYKNIPYKDWEEAVEMISDNMYSALNIRRKESPK